MQGSRRGRERVRVAPAALQRWEIVEQRINREIAILGVAIGIACVSLFGFAMYNRGVAQFLTLIIMIAIGRLAYLFVKRTRAFIAIMVAGGMTREEAKREFVSRYPSN